MERQVFLSEKAKELQGTPLQQVEEILDKVSLPLHWAAAQTAVAQWLSGATVVETFHDRVSIPVPVLDDELRKEVQRLLSLTKIRSMSFRDKSEPNHTTTESRCVFSIGTWKSTAVWHCESYGGLQESNLYATTDGFDEFTSSADIRRQIGTSMPSLVFYVYVFLISFELLDRYGCARDHRPDFHYTPWLSEYAVKEWRPGTADPEETTEEAKKPREEEE